MTDANIVRWLGYQTSKKVGLTDLSVIRLGAQATKRMLEKRVAEGCSYIVTDAVGDEDLLVIAEATRDWPLLSGGSGITAAMAAHALSAPVRTAIRSGTGGDWHGYLGGFRQPVAHDAAAGGTCPGARLGRDPSGRAGRASRHVRLGLHRGPRRGGIVSQPAGAGVFSFRSRWASNRGVDIRPDLGTQRCGDRQPHCQRAGRGGASAGPPAAGQPPGRSPAARRPGAVCRRLGIQAVEVGTPISPGVPFCFTWPDRRLLLVLKSGNFGSEGFVPTSSGFDLRASRMTPAIFPFKNVSITGGTGTVGSQFIKVLLAQFPHVEKINTTCRSPHGATARRIPVSPRVHMIYGGIQDPSVLKEIVDRGEIVYHLAAWLANTDMPDMTSIYVTNSLAPALLAILCARVEEEADLHLFAQRLFRRALRGTHRGRPVRIPPRLRRLDRGGQERLLRPGRCHPCGRNRECRRRGVYRRDSPQAAPAL